MDGAELLAAVIASPDDDDARMVYADWLLEKGDPRGELIQIQCAIGATLHGASAYRSRKDAAKYTSEELAAREKSLLKKHAKTWLEPIRPFIRTWSWRRGFVNSVVADGKKFLDGAKTIFATIPLEHAELTGMKPPDLELLAKTPELRALPSLSIAQNRIGPKTAHITHSPHFAGLRKLDIWGNPLGEAGGQIFAQAPHLDSLEELVMSTCDLTSPAMDAISRAKFFPRLKKLDLRFNGALDSAIGEYLGRGESLTHIDLFRVRGSSIGDVGVEALAASPNLKNLVELDLGSTEMTERGVHALVDSPHLVSLKKVSVAGHDLGEELERLLRERFPS